MKLGQLQNEGGWLLRRFDNYPLITYVESGQHGLARTSVRTTNRLTQWPEDLARNAKSAKWATNRPNGSYKANGRTSEAAGVQPQ